ncbi:MAG: metallophosphoesterase [Planctomycetaceae bacterium]|nr:metallophosphoesterase [Planctomycetaceae bacterium]
MTHHKLTRRSFLKGVFAAGVASAMPQSLMALDSGPADLNCVALLSDPHVNTVLYKRTVARALAQAAAVPSGPANVILAGDLALNGRQKSYVSLGEVLDAADLSRMKPHLMVGNHDRHTPFFEGLGKYAGKSPVTGRQVSLIETPNANWLLLDSMGEGDPRGWSGCSLGHKQISWLTHTLDAHKDKPAIVVAHHHLKVINWSRRPAPLEESDQVLGLLLARPQVKAYINGHIHVWFTSQYRGLHLISLPSVSYTLPVTGGPLGWVLAQAKGDCLDLTLKAANTRRKDHNQTLHLPYRTSA